MTLTFKEGRAIDILRKGPLFPSEFYLLMWPDGKYAKQRDSGNMHGGPSRSECASNWFLGRLARKGLVRRLNDGGEIRPGVRLDGRWALVKRKP